VPSATEVAAFIRQRREELGYSQEKLAQLVGVSRVSIGSWEDGKHSISGRHLSRLAQALRLKDPGPLCADPVDLATSGTLRQAPTVPDMTSREVLYEFLDSELAAGLDPPLTPRDIAWLMDHHVDGAVTPEYFFHALMMQRSRLKDPKPPSDRPNEAAGAAERSGLKRRDGASQRKPAKRP
jgi:transcriptional regulator with XRE-family HTH domain